MLSDDKTYLADLTEQSEKTACGFCLYVGACAMVEMDIWSGMY